MILALTLDNRTRDTRLVNLTRGKSSMTINTNSDPQLLRREIV
jgi:hypothetical protein